jgi:superfamily II DNA or RNA helicase
VVGSGLRQAARTLTRAFPQADLGYFAGPQGELTAQFVFASVQKLSLAQHRVRLQSQAFDYVVIDEVHHATARSYQLILGELRARFVLGLTATPDRSDEASVEGLFDEHVAHRADMGAGIQAGLLAPFRYFGLKDTADYANIPWRNGRFDEAALEAAVETQARMEKAWQGWQEHPGARTLVFCCTIAHAGFVGRWLRGRGVRVAVGKEALTVLDFVGTWIRNRWALGRAARTAGFGARHQHSRVAATLPFRDCPPFSTGVHSIYACCHD